MMHRAWLARLSVVLVVVAAPMAWGWQDGESSTAPYMRMREAEDGLSSVLEMSIRSLVREAGGPVVHLVGVVHIADQSFYDDLQAFLDAQDLVLYEGVGGAKPVTGAAGDADARKVAGTEARLRLAAMLLDTAKRKTGSYPRTLEDLPAKLPGVHRSVVQRAMVDAWGTPLMARMGEDGYQLTSFGADGEPGGEGADGDLTVAGRGSVKPDVPKQPGIQQQLADALGLEFQLRGIDYDRHHWRNSDMTVEQLSSVLRGGGGAGVRAGAGDGGVEDGAAEDGGADDATMAAANQLFRALSGESMMSRMAGMLLRFVSMSEGMRATAKLMLLETIARADVILEAQLGDAGRLLEVLIVDRNTVVLDDLRRIMEEMPELGSVAVFYGAGHFPDIERRMVEEMGFEFAGELWVPAIAVDLEEAGLDPEQVKAMRAMVSRMLDAQTGPRGRR